MITKEQAIERLTNLATVLKAIDSFKGPFDHFDRELEEIANDIADSDLDPEGNALDCLDTGISFYFDSFEEDKADALVAIDVAIKYLSGEFKWNE